MRPVPGSVLLAYVIYDALFSTSAKVCVEPLGSLDVQFLSGDIAGAVMHSESLIT